jgi:hypothetical protein
MLGEEMLVCATGELAAAIGVDDELGARPSLEEGHAQGSTDEASVEALMHGPTDHPAGAEIEDGDQIQPALASQDAGRIGHPDLIWTTHDQALETVGSDRSTVPAVGRAHAIFGALPGEEPLGAHEPGNAIAPPGAAQRMGEPRTAVGLVATGELVPDTLVQTSGLHLPRARLASEPHPIVITAARDQERFTQPRLTCIGRSSVGSGIPLCGTSERMPSDFFSTSRCSKSFAFSVRKRRMSASRASTLRSGFRAGWDVFATRSRPAQR